MEISHRIVDEVLVVKPEFITLDAKEVPQFKETIHDIIDNKNPSGTLNVVLDMEKLDFIDSSGLGSFLSLMRHLRENGGQLKLANMKKQVHTIFELVSMNKAFEIFESVDAAVKSFS